MKSPLLIKGGIHTDERGTIMHVNDLDMSEICRMYHFHQKDISTIRAWQGHKAEQKWFHCIKGSYTVRLVPLDDFVAPSTEIVPEQYLLSAQSSEVLHIPCGYANGFKAAEADSILLVFSNMDVAQSSADLIRFEQGYWNTNWHE